MSDPFLDSDEYAESAHKLYNAGRLDEAIELIREGLSLFPSSVDLNVGLGYAHLAREEYAWARNDFKEALTLDPNDEEALAGMGETLLKFGARAEALRNFDKLVALGFGEDHDLMLQVARALFRECQFELARTYFQHVAEAHAESAEAISGLAYANHRLGNEDEALRLLRNAMDIDPEHVEARIYLGNVLYDRGEYEAALFHYQKTAPATHFDELAVWRLIELKRSIYKLKDDDAELCPWVERLEMLTADIDSLDPVGVVCDENRRPLSAAVSLFLFVRRRACRRVRVPRRTPAGTREPVAARYSLDRRG